MGKCHSCAKNGKIELKYLGKWLCEPCFCDLIRRRMSKTMRKSKLIERGDKILVAISGGKDSTVTLNYLANYCKRRDVPIFALYVDRGDEYSVNSGLAAERVAKTAGVRFYARSFEDVLGASMSDVTRIAVKLGTNKCSVCGVFRRRVIELVAKELGATKVATGHNLTDEATSVLMNVGRGEINGFRNGGAISLPRKKGLIQRIKILRDIPDSEVKLYADFKGFKYFPDQCPCRVGSLRFKFLAILDQLEESRPGSEFAIVKLADKVRDLLLPVKESDFSICGSCSSFSADENCRVCQYLALK